MGLDHSTNVLCMAKIKGSINLQHMNIINGSVENGNLSKQSAN
jgi:hypothetical protein